MKSAAQRVLVIDDDGVALELLSARIHASGFEVVPRRSAPSVQEVKRMNIAAVICDLVMEGMDGERVLASLHGEPELREVPFILVSSDGARLDETRRRMPWLHCVRKDGPLVELTTTLYRLMERRTVQVQAAARGRPSFEESPSRLHAAPVVLRPTPSGTRPLAGNRDRGRFFTQLQDAMRVLRPYLIGGVLGPRAHGEVKRRLAALRSDAGSALLGSTLEEALELCDRLTDRAQRDLRAMELLGACTGWLATLGGVEALPLTIDGVPVLLEAKAYLA